MDFNEMKKDAASRSEFAKLENNVPTKVKFLSDDFKKVDTKFGIKYEVSCIINGQKKLFQGSARTYDKCMIKANNRNKKFTELVYIITKSGEGLATQYDVDVAEASPAFEEGEVDTSSVPF